jgi:hypothetical protein
VVSGRSTGGSINLAGYKRLAPVIKMSYVWIKQLDAFTGFKVPALRNAQHICEREEGIKIDGLTRPTAAPFATFFTLSNASFTAEARTGLPFLLEEETEVFRTRDCWVRGIAKFN